jgi:5-methylcytosine-specific restriction protein A
MKKKLCNHPGCNRLVDIGARYCAEHTRERKPFENAVRTNDSLYNTAAWRKLRGKIVKEHPYCARCGMSKKETSLHVHHVIEPRGNEVLFFDEHNLVPVCESCHQKITAEEIRRRKN